MLLYTGGSIIKLRNTGTTSTIIIDLLHDIGNRRAILDTVFLRSEVGNQLNSIFGQMTADGLSQEG